MFEYFSKTAKMIIIRKGEGGEEGRNLCNLIYKHPLIRKY